MVDAPCADRHRARRGAADVDQVAPLRRVADEVALEEDRPQQQDVGRVGDRPVAHVGVVQRDDVAVAQVGDLVRRVLDDRRDRAAELPDHHARVTVGDQRELVGLLADDRADGGRLQHTVHLVARVGQRVLDDVERDLVDVVLAHEVGQRRSAWRSSALLPDR